VVAGLCLIIHAASGAPWRWGYLWFLAFASLATLAFEIARKTNLPYQEHVGVPSYTSELGQRGARWLLCATYLGVAVSVAGVVFALGGGPLWAIPAGLLTSAAGWATAWGSAERVELGASLVLLAGFAAAGGVALVVT